jgi:3-deoxy-D-manno-octulosonic-acid transferase
MIPPMFLAYEVLLYLVLIIALPYFVLRGFLRGKYLANFPERMGFYRTSASEHDLWIHAVSVGETVAARPVVDEILRRRPATSIVLTTTTLTGQAQAHRSFPEATVTYFPFDFSVSVKRFLNHHQPRVLATMETEIWPNVTRLARARGIRLIMANGRISDRSFPRYRAMRWVVGRILRSYARILVREDTDRQRFLAIGAAPENVETSGNVKFDYVPDDRPLEFAPLLQEVVGKRKVLVLGSTMQGEDEVLIPALERLLLQREVFVILAPRKGERFEVVAALLATSSIAFVRRTEMGPGVAGGSVTTDRPDLLLLDTFGELAKIYRYATAAFIGGSLVPAGGHNPIEAAAAGVPVCFGPHMSNFREIASVFLRDGAAVEARGEDEVVSFAAKMLSDPAEQAAMGERARQSVARNRGAAARTATRIVELLA